MSTLLLTLLRRPAGVCVVGLMALVTRFGAAPSAYAALGLGALSWLVAEYLPGLDSAFLLSFAVALLAYVAAARWRMPLGGLAKRRGL